MQLGKPYYLQRYRGRVGGASGGGGGSAAIFVSKSTYALSGASDSAIPIPASMATGDVLVVHLIEGSGNTTTTLKANGSAAFFTVGSGGDAIPSAGGMQSYLYWKVLTAGDISNGFLTVAFGTATDGLVLSAYRGLTTVTVKGFVQPGGTTVTFSGFAPDAATKGVGASFIQTGAPGAVTITATGWTQRDGGPTPTAFFGDALLDELTGYTNASVGFSGFPATGAIGAYIYEFT